VLLPHWGYSLHCLISSPPAIQNPPFAPSNQAELKVRLREKGFLKRKGKESAGAGTDLAPGNGGLGWARDCSSSNSRCGSSIGKCVRKLGGGCWPHNLSGSPHCPLLITQPCSSHSSLVFICDSAFWCVQPGRRMSWPAEPFACLFPVQGGVQDSPGMQRKGLGKLD
jgi:hypothetical protein